MLAWTRQNKAWLASVAVVGCLAAAGAALRPGEATGQAAGGLVFADWREVTGGVASGTLGATSISLSGSDVNSSPASTLDGSSTVFNRPEFSPPLRASDAIHFIGSPGGTYTLQFGAPVTNPVLHLGSVASTLEFPAGTEITRLSGDSQFSVSGNTVIGGLDLPSDDANGSVRLSGTFTSIPFRATFQGSDGIYLQVGVVPPARPRPDPLPDLTPPPPPARLDDLPPPRLGRLANVAPVSGTVLLAVPAGSAGVASARASQKGLTFVPLREARQIPVGSFLNTRRGTVRLRSARDPSGRSQTGDFRNGLFQVLQSRDRRRRGLTELVLKGGSFARSRCTLGHGASGARTARHRLRRRVVRRLRGNASGARFSTRGRDVSATVRGTVWEVIDRCDGTLTRVTRGSVVVRDRRRRKSIVVRAGKRTKGPGGGRGSYFARRR